MISQRTWANGGTFHLMRRVVQAHNALWRERLPSLTPVQYSVLLSVHHLPGADQKTVGAASAVEPTTMANLIGRMEKSGLIVRTSDPLDGRRHCLRLTPAGELQLADASVVVQSVRDDILAVTGEADIAELRRILGVIASAEQSTSPGTHAGAGSSDHDQFGSHDRLDRR